MRRLTPNLSAAAAELLARAFEGDPIFQFLFEDRSRLAWLRWMMGVTVRQGLRSGTVFAVDEGERLASVALTFPPGAWPLGTFSYVRAGLALPPGLPPWRFLNEGRSLESAVGKRHPPVPHWYLYVLGVDPDFVGRGFGGALLRHVTAEADAAHVPAHLETTNPKNLTLYRKFGFEVTDEVTIANAPPAWVMTRPPQ